MSDTEWTPEARKIREAQNLAYAEAVHDNGSSWAAAHMAADKRYPAPPPEYTYGREVPSFTSGCTYRRRSDGQWEIGLATGVWRASPYYTDAKIRAVAAEVPLTDVECDALMDGSWGAPGKCTWSEETRDKLRTAFVRVMRGEVGR
jgi:hypothetical protein